jgi:hypothetical protein
MSDQIPAGHKKCSTCKEVLPLNNFYKKTKNKDGMQGECKHCKNTHIKKHKEKNRAARNLSYYRQRRSSLKHYGCTDKNLTPETIMALEILSNGVCDLSGQKIENVVVDHDHDTGLIRGILDNKINLMLGAVERAIKLGLCEPTGAVAEYLANPPAQQLIKQMNAFEEDFP